MKGLAAGAATIALALTGCALADASETTTSVPTPARPPERADACADVPVALSEYPKNQRGQTYGSDALVDSPDEGPDLVSVVGDHGTCGFVLAEELAGPDFSSPEQALAWQSDVLRQGPPSIPVYDVQGETVVDTFTLSLGTASP